MACILRVDVPDDKDSLRNVEMEEDTSNPSESSIKTNSYSNQELLLAEEADKEDAQNPSESSTKTNSCSKEELLLAEDGDEEYEETDDESDDNELDTVDRRGGRG